MQQAVMTKKPNRTLLVVASGSMEASITGRNALGRHRIQLETGEFSRLEYLFFRTEVSQEHHLDESFRVVDVSGREPSGPLAHSRWIRRIALWRSGVREIDEQASRIAPDVVAALDPFIAGWIAYRQARRLTRPFLITLVSNYRLSWEVAGMNPIPFLPPSISFVIERYILGRADRIHVDCQHYGEYAISRGVSPERVRVIPRYADPVFYDGRVESDILARLGINDSRPCVYVGRLSPEKYSLELLESFRRVHQERPHAQLVIVGGGGVLENEFLDQSIRLGLRQAIHLIRGLEAQEIRSLLASAGVVFATHAGYALLEAALAEAPVVAYNFEWQPEVITTGETGLLVPYRDAEAMADAALELLNDPTLAKQMGRSLGEKARREYSVQRTRDALGQSYRQLLGRTPT